MIETDEDVRALMHRVADIAPMPVPYEELDVQFGTRRPDHRRLKVAASLVLLFGLGTWAFVAGASDGSPSIHRSAVLPKIDTTPRATATRVAYSVGGGFGLLDFPFAGFADNASELSALLRQRTIDTAFVW